MTRNRRGWLTVEQLREGLPEQAAKTGRDGILSVVQLAAVGDAFTVTQRQSKYGALIRRTDDTYTNIDDARRRFQQHTRRFTR